MSRRQGRAGEQRREVAGRARHSLCVPRALSTLGSPWATPNVRYRGCDGCSVRCGWDVHTGWVRGWGIPGGCYTGYPATTQLYRSTAFPPLQPASAACLNAVGQWGSRARRGNGRWASRQAAEAGCSPATGRPRLHGSYTQ